MANYLPPKLSDFINGIFNKKTDMEQDIAMAFADRQNDTLIAYLKYIKQLINKISISVLDYGCGEKAVLFFVLNHMTGDDFTKNIHFFGVNKSLVKPDRLFDTIILKYANQKKEERNVFFTVNEFTDLITKNQSPEIDIIILKNVLHEVEYLDFPQLLINIKTVLRSNRYLVIYDFVDFKKCELNRIPYDLAELKSLFIAELLFDYVDSHNSTIPFEYQERKNKTQLTLLILQINEISLKFSEKEIQNKIYNFINNKKKKHIQKKRSYEQKIISGISLAEQEMFDCIKNDIYLAFISDKIETIKHWE